MKLYAIFERGQEAELIAIVQGDTLEQLKQNAEIAFSEHGDHVTTSTKYVYTEQEYTVLKVQSEDENEDVERNELLCEPVNFYNTKVAPSKFYWLLHFDERDGEYEYGSDHTYSNTSGETPTNEEVDKFVYETFSTSEERKTDEGEWESKDYQILTYGGAKPLTEEEFIVVQKFL